eukprot:Hpha_TRINITY_DN4213_c0_g1::TRINITY_DN4213_c0_g1_i2::g.186762::m.186762/K00542/GAMT; guanidinoacetate N-methyltransferase
MDEENEGTLLERVLQLEAKLNALAEAGESTEEVELELATQLATLERESEENTAQRDAAGRKTFNLRDEWATAPARFSADGSRLTILGEPVMEDWETPYMEALSKTVGAQGGRVLEVGYGLGLSARALGLLGQSEGEVQLGEHVIIEANIEVAAAAETYAKSAPVPTTVLKGFWQDIVPELPPGSFSGVLFDAYPLTREEWAAGEVDSFFKEAVRLLKPGGVFTFYFDIAKSWHDSLKRWREDIVPVLNSVGFGEVSYDDIQCAPPPDCRYFW